MRNETPNDSDNPLQPQNATLHLKRGKFARFADVARGLFFISATASLVVLMLMFITVWQPIWTAGFNDFHTISEAINKLDDTAKPASSTIPQMLERMTEMSQAMQEMQQTMNQMQQSMKSLEQITPNIQQMNSSIEAMNRTLSAQMGQMSYLIGRIEHKLSPSGMMPNNW